MAKAGGLNVVGTIQLIDHGEIVLIPTPTREPRGSYATIFAPERSSVTNAVQDPLNLPAWRKWTALIVVSLFASTATLIASGVGAVLPFFYEQYHDDPRVNDLVTFPSLFIGIGNLITVPISHAVGRRPVFLLSTLVFVLASVWAGLSQSLSSHIAARAFVSMAAGSAEALCPIIVQVSAMVPSSW